MSKVTHRRPGLPMSSGPLQSPAVINAVFVLLSSAILHWGSKTNGIPAMTEMPGEIIATHELLLSVICIKLL